MIESPMEDVLFDSRDSHFKTPFGCIEQGGTLELRLWVLRSRRVRLVTLVMQQDDRMDIRLPMNVQEQNEEYDIYRIEFPVEHMGLYFYVFELTDHHKTQTVYRDSKNYAVFDVGNRWQFTCYKRGFTVPEAFSGKLMYQIFPDRFFCKGECDCSQKLQPYTLHENKKDAPLYKPDENKEVLNNDFFGGNLQGIIEKLPYIRSYGVGVIYLNPIFLAYSNHRYDTSDYRRVDPMLGTEEDLRELCQKAHALSMKVILDGVFSHTGSNSVYFDKKNIFGQGAYHHPDSPYREWYTFTKYPDAYDAWWGIDTLPCVNELNENYLNFILYQPDSVVKHWLAAGVDGFRLDVADELPDEFLLRFYSVVKSVNPDAFVMGEVWEDASNKISYSVRRKYLLGSEMDSVMNYVYKDGIIQFVKREIDAFAFHETVMSLAENYPPMILNALMNILSTHDTPRIATVLGGLWFKEKDVRATAVMDETATLLSQQRMCAAVFLQYTLPGMPCIYYGDEIGMQGYEDPFNRRFFDWDCENEFLQQMYRQLGLLRAHSKAISVGTVSYGYVEEWVYGFYRTEGKEKMFCVVNLSDQPVVLECQNMSQVYSCGAYLGEDSIMLSPYGNGVYAVNAG